ncbi:nickel insertion protein [Methanogenium cariaci]|uniref:nickel insertion protein n=1 Tax=Methanogenium cariaci TaxID=2197 RepID=UPI00247FC867|nr:nickel insertion protein [Methanogenium cariaci]
MTSVDRCGIRALKIETHAGPASRSFHEVCDIVSGADASCTAKDMAVRVFTRIKDAEEGIHGAHTHFHEVGGLTTPSRMSSVRARHFSLFPSTRSGLPRSPLGQEQ